MIIKSIGSVWQAFSYLKEGFFHWHMRK